MNKLFFVDTCIWLNLFKREGDSSKGKPYFKISEDFLEKVMFSKELEIYYSGLILKEIKYILEDDLLFEDKKNFMRKEFFFAKASSSDYILGRKIESELNYELSFFDSMHIAMAFRLKCTLVTRDKDLLKLSKNYVKSSKPEDLEL
ncbi:MAG: type II toxin-antitoxin system VapC family toxin [Nanobdellota archaeon]